LAEFDARQPPLPCFWVSAIGKEWPSGPETGLPTPEGARLIVEVVKEYGVVAIHCRFAWDECLATTTTDGMSWWSGIFEWKELNDLVGSAIALWQREVRLGRVNPSTNNVEVKPGNYVVKFF
jgi:hypothetical protein